MNFRDISVTNIWGVISRTRPFVPSSKQRPKVDRTRGKWCVLGREFWYFLYQGLGVTAPLGMCYVIGVVVEGISEERIIYAVLVAMVTSLLTGLCYAELITSHRQCSGNASTAIYQLVGEFPAYCTAVYSALIACSCFCAMSKALSATMEELSHQRLSAFITNLIGTLPVSNSPPDVLGFGAALVTSVLLACGLKQAGFLRTAMNVACGAGFIFFLSVGGRHTKDKYSDETNGSTAHQSLAGGGVLCCLFLQFLVLGRRSKSKSRAKVILPLAISVTFIFVLILSLGLGILLTLMLDEGRPVSGAPLLQALQLRDVGWARIVMGSIQIVIIGFGISEAGESVCRHLVNMSSNGFIPSFLSQECQMAFSHSRAHLIGGVGASVMALLLTHVYILEFMAANILLLNILIVLVTMYRPFRCSYDSLCSISVIPSSREGPTALSSSRLKASKQLSAKKHAERTLHFLKNGMRVIALRKLEYRFSGRDDELGMPLLSSPEAGVTDAGLLAINDEDIYENPSTSKAHQDSQKDTPDSRRDPCQVISSENLEAGSNTHLVNFKSKYCENNCENVSADINSNDCELLSLNQSPASSDESEVDEGEEQDEFIIDEDVDTIVAEYKEQLRISTRGSGIKPLPSISTARKAFFYIFILAFTSIFLSVFSLYFPGKNSVTQELTLSLKSFSALTILLVMFAILVMLTQLPTVKHSASPQNGFRLPGSVWICFIALFLNVLLFVEVFERTMWTVLPLNIIAFLWYAFYSSKNSVVAISRRCDGFRSSEEEGDNEMVCLSPVFPTSVITSRPQREGHNRKV